VSLAEIEKAVDALSPEELAQLASFIRERENAVWDEEIDRDFSPGGKHEPLLKKIDAQIRKQ
jgi:hypothetical protein